MPMNQRHVLDRIATAIDERPSDAPILIGIDGRSAAGKTTLADALAAHLDRGPRQVLRSSIDDFHPAGHKYRSAERRYTPATYFAEGFEYAKLRAMLLDPLRATGNRRCRLDLWDSFHDQPLPEHWIDVAPDAIVVVDGIFLLHPDLRSYWDYVLWLHVGWDTMIERAARRDVAWLGSEDVVRERYRTFWVPTHSLYESICTPIEHAHLVLDNSDPEHPVVISGSAVR